MLLSDTLRMQHSLQGGDVPKGLESWDVDHTDHFRQGSRSLKPSIFVPKLSDITELFQPIVVPLSIICC